MILWTWGYRAESTPQFADIGRRAWRWVLEASLDPEELFASIGASMQVRFLDRPDSRFDEKDSWRGGVRYFDANLTNHFRIGSSHTWCDGPHCSLSLGFLHLCWSNVTCRKCEEGL